MKVIMYVAPTPNGKIAREGHKENFVSAANWRLFVRIVKQVGSVIIGRTTFEVAAKSGVFPIRNALNVVMTRKKVENRWGKDALFTDKSPKEVLRMLQGMGYKKVIMAGGSGVSTSFIKQKLIDEIRLDFQPVMFGRGTPIFVDDDFDAKLRLLGIKKLSKNEVQLRYRVLNRRRT
jgi:dihydrofolate reductase